MIGTQVLIIAEAGVNHNGQLDLALQLIDKAADAGADVVKFQTFKSENLVSISAEKAEYQINNSSEKTETQYEMLKKLELKEEWYSVLIDRCRARGIQFLSTGFDEESMDFLEGLNFPFYKIPSGEITNRPYLLHVAGKRKPVILSTGMANLQEVKAAVTVLEEGGLKRSEITVLHCNTEYPTPFEDVNLKAMNHIKEELGLEIGYSDHTLGIEVSLAAVALGAKVIEKHFTLDRKMDGPDHAASLEPNELKLMVSGIRNIEKALKGSGKKEPSESERKNILIARKSIHLSRDLNKGEFISTGDLMMLRPADGISPMEIDNVIGKCVKRSLSKGSILRLQDVE